MISFVYLVILLILLYLFNKFWLRPTKIIKSYQKQFQKAGFRVKLLGFNPLSFKGYSMFVDDYKKFGDCFKTYKEDLQGYDLLITNIGNIPLIRLHSPELIKEFCAKERQFYYEKNQIRMKFFNRITGTGVVSSEKEQWKRKRKILNNVFNYDFITRTIPNISQICKFTLKKFDQQCEPQNITYKVDNMTSSITSSVIFQSFFGGSIKNQTIDGESVANYLVKINNDSHKQILNPLVWLFGTSYLDLGIKAEDRDINIRIKKFNGWAKSYLQCRMNEEQKKLLEDNYQPTNIIGAILQQNNRLKQNSEIEYRGYSSQQILDQFKTLFLAGTDTTAHLVQTMIYYVLKQNLEKKLRKQIEENIKENQITSQNLKNMKFLESIQKQTLRVFGPANMIFARSIVQDHEIKGIKLFKGTCIHYCSAWTHFSADEYANPLQYRPERWVDGSCDKLNPFAYVPFHSGSRSCLGKSLALLESKIMMIQIFRRYSKIRILEQKVGLKLQFLFQTDNYHIKAEKAHQKDQ